MSYQSIVDGMRRSLATELLENTHMSIDQVAERIGFADATSFRKAFKKWTNRSPTDFRRPDRGRQARPRLANSRARIAADRSSAEAAASMVRSWP